MRDHYTTAAWRNLTVTPGGTTSLATLPYYAPFAGGSASGWTPYGGTWSVSGPNETYSDSAGGAGDKSVAGSTAWTNYTLQGDVELTSAGSNANPGILVRVTNPAVGADALQGYYAGVASDGTLVVGRENNGWTYLSGAAVPGGVSLNNWYHLIFQVQGCNLTIAAQSIASSDQAIIKYTDAGCTQTAGQIGVRTFNAAASWRYISMSPN